MLNKQYFKVLALMSIGLVCETAAFKKLLVGDPTLVDANALTTDASKNNAFGCMCDITFQSCDVYCCCDPDCDANVRNFWTENYNDYCAKNQIMSKYKPNTQCVDQNIISGYNKRMGM